jgi:putative PIN family toxin of toxin-antitoxin system
VLRAALDANVYISALLRPEGPPGRIIERFLRKVAFDIVLSPTIVHEVLRAFAYPKIGRLIRGAARPELWFEDIMVLADLVSGDDAVSGVCADPDDDKYIGAAIEGRAALIVTGDRQLLALIEHDGVRIISPRAFLDLLGD